MNDTRTRREKEDFMSDNCNCVLIEASGRHVHLSRNDAEALFGAGYEFTKVKDLSQPGQFACAERVTIKGPKRSIENVVILGPERKDTQVEVSLTDCSTLGIKAPIRLSGDIEGSPGIEIINPQNGNSVTIDKGLIVAKRHMHITPEDAKKMNVENGEIIKVHVNGERETTFDEVDVRVSKDFATAVHIDYDEANACGLNKDSQAHVVKKV